MDIPKHDLDVSWTTELAGPSAKILASEGHRDSQPFAQQENFMAANLFRSKQTPLTRRIQQFHVRKIRADGTDQQLHLAGLVGVVRGCG